MTAPLLSIRDLVVNFHGDIQPRTLIDRVSFDLAEGEILGLVGESGSGKSLLCRAIMGLLPSRKLSIDGGSVELGGRDLVGAGEAEMLSIRGSASTSSFVSCSRSAMSQTSSDECE